MSQGKKNLDINYVTIRAKRDKTDKRTKWRAIAHTHKKNNNDQPNDLYCEEFADTWRLWFVAKSGKNNNNNIHQQAPHITHYTHFNKSF